MKHFMLQPEYRKWFSGTFMGSYIGFQVHYALFNFGGMLPGDSGTVKCWESKTSRLPTIGIKAIWQASASPTVING